MAPSPLLLSCGGPAAMNLRTAMRGPQRSTTPGTPATCHVAAQGGGIPQSQHGTVAFHGTCKPDIDATSKALYMPYLKDA